MRRWHPSPTPQMASSSLLDGIKTRDVLLVVGIGAAWSARHFYRRRMLRPFQFSTLLAWPALGVSLMQTIEANVVRASSSPQLHHRCCLPLPGVRDHRHAAVPCSHDDHVLCVLLVCCWTHQGPSPGVAPHVDPERQKMANALLLEHVKKVAADRPPAS